jgi:hypothetical protein
VASRIPSTALTAELIRMQEANLSGLYKHYRVQQEPLQGWRRKDEWPLLSTALIRIKEPD